MEEESNNYFKQGLSMTEELKLKSLEARLLGPSKDGHPPILSNIEAVYLETIKSSKPYL